MKIFECNKDIFISNEIPQTNNIKPVYHLKNNFHPSFCWVLSKLESVRFH